MIAQIDSDNHDAVVVPASRRRGGPAVTPGL
jgi:hypothetical protein